MKPPTSLFPRYLIQRFAICGWFGLVVACVPWRAADSFAEEGLRAGIAKIDITPAEPVTLAGYQSRQELSKGVHDPLSARAIAFEQNGRRLVLLSTDVLGFYNGSAPVIRQAVMKECQLKPEELFLAAIHTHSAPAVTFDPARGHANNVAYSKVLEQKLVEVIRQALSALAPVRIGFGSGAAPVGSNRRQMVTETPGTAKVILGRNPEAAIDREVQVIRLETGTPSVLKAALFAYATHSTSLGPGNYLISGDVHGLAEQFVEQHLGAPFTAAAFAGASGDIDPWFRVLPSFNRTNNWVPEPVLLGTFLGEEVVHVLSRIKTSPGSGAIKGLFETVQLPGKTNGASVPLNITVASIGDVAFAGFGAEVFNEIGRAIKAASPFSPTIIMTHCNGTAGYLPTRDAYETGGYEVESSPFGPGAAEVLMEKTGQLLTRLRDMP